MDDLGKYMTGIKQIRYTDHINTVTAEMAFLCFLSDGTVRLMHGASFMRNASAA